MVHTNASNRLCSSPRKPVPRVSARRAEPESSDLPGQRQGSAGTQHPSPPHGGGAEAAAKPILMTLPPAVTPPVQSAELPRVGSGAEAAPHGKAGPAPSRGLVPGSDEAPAPTAPGAGPPPGVDLPHEETAGARPGKRGAQRPGKHRLSPTHTRQGARQGARQGTHPGARPGSGPSAPGACAAGGRPSSFPSPNPLPTRCPVAEAASLGCAHLGTVCPFPAAAMRCAGCPAAATPRTPGSPARRAKAAGPARRPASPAPPLAAAPPASSPHASSTSAAAAAQPAPGAGSPRRPRSAPCCRCPSDRRGLGCAGHAKALRGVVSDERLTRLGPTTPPRDPPTLPAAAAAAEARPTRSPRPWPPGRAHARGPALIRSGWRRREGFAFSRLPLSPDATGLTRPEGRQPARRRSCP